MVVGGVLCFFFFFWKIVMYLCASHIIVVMNFGAGFVESWPHCVFGYG